MDDKPWKSKVVPFLIRALSDVKLPESEMEMVVSKAVKQIEIGVGKQIFA